MPWGIQGRILNVNASTRLPLTDGRALAGPDVVYSAPLAGDDDAGVRVLACQSIPRVSQLEMD